MKSRYLVGNVRLLLEAWHSSTKSVIEIKKIKRCFRECGRNKVQKRNLNSNSKNFLSHFQIHLFLARINSQMFRDFTWCNFKYFQCDFDFLSLPIQFRLNKKYFRFYENFLHWIKWLYIDSKTLYFLLFFFLRFLFGFNLRLCIFLRKKTLY